jgi:hypothetical protein
MLNSLAQRSYVVAIGAKSSLATAGGEVVGCSTVPTTLQPELTAINAILDGDGADQVASALHPSPEGWLFS